MLTTMDGSTTSNAPSGALSREQILAVTSQCLAEQGFESTTIRQIAKRLDCAVGSIYRYFNDKHDLLFAVAQQILEPVVDLQEQDASLEETVRCYVSAATTHAQTYRLMFWLAMAEQSRTAENATNAPPRDVSRPGDPEALESPEAMKRARALPPVIENIIGNWRTSLGSAAAAESCWAMLHGWLTLQMSPEPIVSAVLREARTSSVKPHVGPPTPTGGTPNTRSARPTAAAQQPAAKPVVEGDPDFRLGTISSGKRTPPRLATRPHPAEVVDGDGSVEMARPTTPAHIERSFSLLRASLGDAAAKAEEIANEEDVFSTSKVTADLPGPSDFDRNDDESDESKDDVCLL